MVKNSTIEIPYDESEKEVYNRIKSSINDNVYYKMFFGIPFRVEKPFLRAGLKYDYRNRLYFGVNTAYKTSVTDVIEAKIESDNVVVTAKMSLFTKSLMFIIRIVELLVLFSIIYVFISEGKSTHLVFKFIIIAFFEIMMLFKRWSYKKEIEWAFEVLIKSIQEKENIEKMQFYLL